MSFGSRLDALEQRYLAFHQRHAHHAFGFCLVMLVFNVSAYVVARVMAITASPTFACSAFLFAIGAVANFFLAIQPTGSNRTK